MNRQVKDYGKSVRAKLLRLKETSRREYMYLLARYFSERLLYRVSASEYKNNFILKGGSLLYAMDGLDTRPTVDVDFMAESINRTTHQIEGIFKKILNVPCTEDGVWFDSGSLHPELITVEKRYPGVRLHITARMDTIEHNMTIDIGFGDVITPHPFYMDFPTLLPDVPSFEIKAYSIETVVAEKFHTMIERDVTNSRMKDFFDCYQILISKIMDKSVLRDAIEATFENRKLRYNPDLQLFTDSFMKDEARLKRWQAFLKKIKWETAIPFSEVMGTIKEGLKGFLDEYWQSRLPDNCG